MVHIFPVDTRKEWIQSEASDSHPGGWRSTKCLQTDTHGNGYTSFGLPLHIAFVSTWTVPKSDRHYIWIDPNRVSAFSTQLLRAKGYSCSQDWSFQASNNAIARQPSPSPLPPAYLSPHRHDRRHTHRLTRRSCGQRHHLWECAYIYSRKNQMIVTYA